MEILIEIVHEDAELLVINKPAGLVCHPTKTDGYSSLISRIRLYLGEQARPHLINRLDRETSGLVLVAKQDEAARELRQIWETRAVRKEYLAIVQGHVCAEHDVIDAPLGKDERSGVAIKNCVRPDGAPSQTEFSVERRFTRAEGEFALLRLWPRTGRKHQIRIHLAHYGHPIVGDKIYGGDENLYLDFVQHRQTEEQRRRLILPNQGLHACGVRFSWRNSERIFEAEPEGWFAGFAGAPSE
jgi:23S rRNA pseudouridine1911/1915/1917 synthase